MPDNALQEAMDFIMSYREMMWQREMHRLGEKVRRHRRKRRRR